MGAAPQLQVTPTPVILGETTEFAIVIRDFPGTLPIQARANVGQVVGVSEAGGVVKIRIRPPQKRFPQRLCLIVWRDIDQPLVVRIPLLGRTELPIRTRANTQVTLRIGKEIFGPQSSGPRGHLKMRVLIPPGISEGLAEAVASNGMVTRKVVRIQQPAYNTLTLAHHASALRLPKAHVDIVLASAVLTKETPTLWASRGDETRHPIALKEDSAGRWSAHWKVPTSGRWSFAVEQSGSPQARRVVSLRILPQEKAPPPPVPLSPRLVMSTPTPGVQSGWRFAVAAAAGIMHNTGNLFSARLSLNVEGDYPLGPGRVGLQLGTSFAWGSRDVALSAPLESRVSRVLLVPVGLLATYRLSFGRVHPGLAAGPLLHLTRFSGESRETGVSTRTDASFGAVLLLDTHLDLGPGAIVARLGYQYSRVDNEDYALLAGGVIAEFGYRLSF